MGNFDAFLKQTNEQKQEKNIYKVSSLYKEISCNHALSCKNFLKRMLAHFCFLLFYPVHLEMTHFETLPVSSQSAVKSVAFHLATQMKSEEKKHLSKFPKYTS